MTGWIFKYVRFDTLTFHDGLDLFFPYDIIFYVQLYRDKSWKLMKNLSCYYWCYSQETSKEMKYILLSEIKMEETFSRDEREL